MTKTKIKATCITLILIFIATIAIVSLLPKQAKDRKPVVVDTPAITDPFSDKVVPENLPKDVSDSFTASRLAYSLVNSRMKMSRLIQDSQQAGLDLKVVNINDATHNGYVWYTLSCNSEDQHKFHNSPCYNWIADTRIDKVDGIQNFGGSYLFK